MAIGILEIQNLTNAYKATDMVLKNSSTSLIHHKKSLGGRLITLVFDGGVSDLEAAFDVLRRHYKDTYVLKVAEVIANPAPELMNYFRKGSFDD